MKALLPHPGGFEGLLRTLDDLAAGLYVKRVSPPLRAGGGLPASGCNCGAAAGGGGGVVVADGRPLRSVVGTDQS
jgi:hypothetical protein